MKEQPWDPAAAHFIGEMGRWANQSQREEMVLPLTARDDRPTPLQSAGIAERQRPCVVTFAPASPMIQRLETVSAWWDRAYATFWDIVEALLRGFAAMAGHGYGIGVMIALSLNLVLMDVGWPTNSATTTHLAQAIGLALLSWLRVAWILAGAL